MCLIVELNVLDTSIRSSNDSLIVLVIHLGSCNGIFCLNASDHVWVIRGHHLGMLVCIPDYTALSARDDYLRMFVDDAADRLTEYKFFLAELKPI